MAELPKIISVDDHVVEPAHVWQTWLPEKHREKGPRVERKRWGAFKLKKGAKYEMTEDPEGEWGDAWIYEDKLIYVQKKFVAIPLAATPGGDVSKFDKTVMTMTATTYDDMRPGCWDPNERKKDFELNWVDGSLPFPTFPRFCGQTFYEADDKELALACVQAYNDWMVEEWCDPSIGVNIPLCIMPLWDVRARGQGDQAQRRPRRARGVLQRAADAARPAEHPHRPLGPDVRRATTPAPRCACTWARRRPTPRRRADAPPGVGSMVAFNNSMASLGDYLFSGKMAQFPKLKIAYSEGQIGWLPYALERADTVWEQHDAWMNAKRLCPEPPSTYYYDRVFGCFTWDQHGVNSLDEVGENQHLLRDRLPAHRHDVAELEGVLREDPRGRRRGDGLQDPPRQRDQDARARPRLARRGSRYCTAPLSSSARRGSSGAPARLRSPSRRRAGRARRRTGARRASRDPTRCGASRRSHRRTRGCRRSCARAGSRPRGSRRHRGAARRRRRPTCRRSRCTRPSGPRRKNSLSSTPP